MRHVLFATSAMAWSAPLLLALAPPVSAQTVEGRVDRLEKEMRAVQRKVFPAGTPIEAQITRPTTPTIAPGSPSSSPISDLTARVGALEEQVSALGRGVGARMTGMEEQLAALTRMVAQLGSQAIVVGGATDR